LENKTFSVAIFTLQHCAKNWLLYPGVLQMKKCCYPCDRLDLIHQYFICTTQQD